MNPDDWQRLKRVFHDALDLRPETRAAWIEEACEGDRALQREVEALFHAHDTAHGFLEQPAVVGIGELVDEGLPAVDDAPRERALASGIRIGAYEVVRELGRGGMGVVYLARDSRLGRLVALKALPTAVAGSAELRERLRREARAAATISHPAVAVVHALEELDDQIFIVSEYVRGHTLRQEIQDGPLPPARALAIATDVARGLQAAHDAGVIHRDLKPENVLVTNAGGVKVVDFGVAHVDGADGARLTRTGIMLGTPAYMAPEQLLGTDVDARADLYAFGVMLAEMLTGHHPTQHDTIRGEALPPHIGPIVTRCLQLSPHARYQSAGDLLAAIDGARAGEHGAALPAGGSVPGRRMSPRWWWEFHQAVAGLTYWLMVIPAWTARGIIGATAGRAFFLFTLAAVIVAANLRFHLWFTSRFYPVELPWVRARSARWIRAADWVFAASLVVGGVLASDGPSGLSVLLVSFGVGAAVAFLLIEPATTRAAFGNEPRGSAP